MKHLIIDANKDLVQRNKYHIVPCQLSTNGQKVPDCQVSNYFSSTISTQVNQQTTQLQTTATIQGHKLVGTKYENLDGLYNCLCYRKQGTQDIQIIAVEKIQNLNEWRKDIGWKKNQGHVGSTILHYNLMDILHSEAPQKVEQTPNNQKNVIEI